LFFCQVQVQDLLIYLYGHRHDIYGSHLCVRRAGSLYRRYFMYIYGLFHQVK